MTWELPCPLFILKLPFSLWYGRQPLERDCWGARSPGLAKAFGVGIGRLRGLAIEARDLQVAVSGRATGIHRRRVPVGNVVAELVD